MLKNHEEFQYSSRKVLTQTYSPCKHGLLRDCTDFKLMNLVLCLYPEGDGKFEIFRQENEFRIIII